MKEERKSIKEVPVYESPKVTSLDEKNAIFGQQNGIGCNPSGSGNLVGCQNGNVPGPIESPFCGRGSAGAI